MERSRVKRRPSIQKQFRQHALSVYPFCQWCALPLTEGTATTDHLVPLSRGGTNDWDNLCLACLPCNRKRKNDLPCRSPTGPCWGGEGPPRVLVSLVEAVWVAWTRYPGGRWRPTLRDDSPERLRRCVVKLMGKTVEVLILLEGQGPAD